MWATLIPMILTWVGQRVNQITNASAGKMEKQYRREVESDLERLSRGEGGLAAGQTARLQSQARSAIDSQVSGALSDLARGANGEAGASGVQQQAANSMRAQGAQALRGAQSDIRNADVNAIEALRQRQLMVIELAGKRKAMATGTPTGVAATGGSIGTTDEIAFAGGQGARADMASGAATLPT